jgi:hypothetical protein
MVAVFGAWRPQGLTGQKTTSFVTEFDMTCLYAVASREGQELGQQAQCILRVLEIHLYFH